MKLKQRLIDDILRDVIEHIQERAKEGIYVTNATKQRIVIVPPEMYERMRAASKPTETKP